MSTLFTAAPIFAQQIESGNPQKADSVRSVSLNAATQQAIANSPELRKIGWEVEQAHSDGHQQSRLINPSVGAMANEIGNEGQGGQYGLYYQRNIVRNNRTEQIQNAYQWKANGLTYRARVEQRKIAREVGAVFITRQFIQRQIALNLKRQAELANIKRIAESLMKGGEIAPLELAKIELEIETVQQRTKTLQFELEKQGALLNSFLGTEGPVELDFSFDDEVNMVLQSNPERDLIPSDHPSFKLISDQIEEFKWRYQVAIGKKLPDWQLQTSVNFDTASDDFFAGFQINIPWMVLDRKEGLINSAAIKIQLLQEEQQRIGLQLKRQFITLHNRRLALISRIQSIDKRILPMVDKAATDTARLFHAGEIDYKSVKEAMMQSYDWRETRLELARELLLVEIQSETLLAE